MHSKKIKLIPLINNYNNLERKYGNIFMISANLYQNRNINCNIIGLPQVFLFVKAIVFLQKLTGVNFNALEIH